ncbi:MAG: hypothetical protein JRN39_04000 [Nitrososphaerota archaeon]|nr:hypothetical protein [Nitrososphaerota archaeon]
MSASRPVLPLTLSALAIVIALVSLGVLFAIPGPQGPPGAVPSGINSTLSSLQQQVLALQRQVDALQGGSVSSGSTVMLTVVPDYGGAGYDAFVPTSATNGTVPASGSSGPGPVDNNITVKAGVPVTFVITNIDTAVLENFTGATGVNLVLYNDTDSGMVAQSYGPSQALNDVPVSHTFTVDSLHINVPIPPDTVVAFTYTFSAPGVYLFYCQTPCGPGMSLAGYMQGYVVVS